MKKMDKVKKIQQILSATYPKPGVPLDHKDPYTLLVAVMLSAQTTDKKVNFLSRFSFGPLPRSDLKDLNTVTKRVFACRFFSGIIYF